MGAIRGPPSKHPVCTHYQAIFNVVCPIFDGLGDTDLQAVALTSGVLRGAQLERWQAAVAGHVISAVMARDSRMLFGLLTTLLTSAAQSIGDVITYITE